MPFLTGLSNDKIYEDLLERREISIINLSKVSDDFLRFDAEYYSRENLRFQKIVSSAQGRTLEKLGGVLDCSAFYPSITGYYSDNRALVPFLRVNEISNGLVVLTDSTVFLPQKVLDDNSKTITSAHPGDIIIAKGGNTLAKVGLVTDEYPKYATCRDVIVLRTDKLGDMNRYFLWTFLHSKYGQGMMWRAATQTGQPHLTLPAISNLHIPEFSNKLQDQCEALYKDSVACKSKAQERYAEATGLLIHELGLDTWKPSRAQVSERSFKDINQAERIDAEYYQPKYDEIIDKIKTRNAYKLRELVAIQKSIEPGSDEYRDRGIPFYRISDFSQFGLTRPDLYLDPSKYANALRIKEGTILLSKDGSVCIAYRVEPGIDGITSSALLHLNIKEDACLPDYLTLVLNSMAVKMQAEQSAGGSIIRHWRMDEINNVWIPVIDRKKQREISDKVQQSFSLRRESVQSLERAKRAVEIAIEKSESAAKEYLESTK